MSLEIQGKLTKFLPVQSGEKKDKSGLWKKQSFIVETVEQYNNLYCFEVFGDEKVDNLTKYQKEGDEVKVVFNVNTNEYQGKYYTTLSAWRIEKVSGGGGEVPRTFPKAEEVNDEEPNDLPF